MSGHPVGPHEAVLAAAARSVIIAFSRTSERRRLSGRAAAALRLLEAALEPYGPLHQTETEQR